MSTKDDSDKGICILSLDSGGPGTYSQLLLIKEYLRRLSVELAVEEEDLYPADHFDMMGGVGLGGLVAFMLGRLRLTASEATDALLTLTSSIFPYDPGNAGTPSENLDNLKLALTDLLDARNIHPNTKMNENVVGTNTKCKVAIYAATSSDITHPRIFRTYPIRGSTINPTILYALCATIADPSYFSTVKIGPRGREQMFAGGPLGAHNPTRELLREAGSAFGMDKRVAQVISFGTGWSSDAAASTVVDLRKDPEDGIERRWGNSVATDCEMVASDLSTRLFTVDAYVRLNVDMDMDLADMDDWTGLGLIESQTSSYLETTPVARSFEISLRYLQDRIGTATLGQINQATNEKASVKVAPALSPYFVARDKPWRAMVHHLIDLPFSNQRIFAITGMGGCGKTQMVSYFLRERGSHFKCVVFVDASSSISLKADLQAWVQSLGDDHEQDVWEDALRVLASDLYEGHWVLILDNADNPALDLSPFFPKCYKGTIIITSRNRHIGHLANTHHLELGEMEKHEALSTLLRTARREVTVQSPEELGAAKILVEKLGYLAVALVQAGTYCDQLSAIAHGVEVPFTFTQYVSLFASHRAALMKRPESSSLDNYQLGAYTAFDISYNSISQPVKDFFHFISSFHHSNISLAMFATAAGRGFKDPDGVVPRPKGHDVIISKLEALLCPEGRWNEIRVHREIHVLRSFSLVSASSTANMVFLHIHPVVHAWAKDMVRSNDQYQRQMTTQVLTCCSTQGGLQLRRYLVPHINELLEDDDAANTHLHITDNLTFASVLRDWGFCEKAEALLKRSLEVARGLYGGDGNLALAVFAMLARTYHQHGKWDTAEALYLENLEHYRRLKGNDHTDTVWATENLASIYSDRGMHKEAEKLKQRVLEYRTKDRGKQDPSTLTAMANLARTYQDQGRYEEAEELGIEVLDQIRRLPGNNQSGIASAASNLASAYNRLGRHKEAEVLMLEALEIRMKLYGEDHPATIGTINNLGGAYNAQGRHKEAEPLMLDVMQKAKRVMGAEHPHAIRSIANLAITYINLGELEKAEPLLYEAVTLGIKVFGRDHPTTKRYATNLADVLTKEEAYDDAEGIRALFL